MVYSGLVGRMGWGWWVGWVEVVGRVGWGGW